MKSFKKMLSVVIALAMVISTFAFVMSFSASAASDGVVCRNTAFARHYGWGNHPQKVTYTTGGYATISDTGRYVRQQQVYFPHLSDAEKASAEAAIKLANDEYNGKIACDVLVTKCNGSNTEAEQVDVGCEISVGVSYKYKDADEIDPVDNPEGWVNGEFTKQGWCSFNTLKTYSIGVDDYPDLATYEDFQITSFRINAMNYANNAFTTGDFKGQAGMGFDEITFSPIYVDGTTVPAKGDDLGEDVTFTENETDPEAAGIYNFTSLGKSYYQLDEGKQGDGDWGNGEDADRTKPVGAVVMYGDVNGDETVNTKDVLLLRKYLAGQKVEINKDCADINSDTTVNTKDLLLLRKHLAGQDVEPWASIG